MGQWSRTPGLKYTVVQGEQVCDLQADELKEKLRSYENSDSSGESSDEDSSVRHNKYARLLELEEEAEDLKNKLEERDEDLKGW